MRNVKVITIDESEPKCDKDIIDVRHNKYWARNSNVPAS